MNAFYSDLDNTLIFSHRKHFRRDDVLVEYLNGKEQSYMTLKLYDLLQRQKIKLVPVTTRSVEQYKRLFIFNENIKCKYALVCNGGILLINGEVDEQWRKESILYSSMQNHEVNRLSKLVRKLWNPNKWIMVDEFMFYAVFEDEIENAYSFIKKTANRNMVSVEKDSRKIYIIAKNINKGNAIYRFADRYHFKPAMGAGDSVFDIPMLNMCEKAYASPKLREMLSDDIKAVYAKNDILAYEIADLMIAEQELGR